MGPIRSAVFFFTRLPFITPLKTVVGEICTDHRKVLEKPFNKILSYSSQGDSLKP